MTKFRTLLSSPFVYGGLFAVAFGAFIFGGRDYSDRTMNAINSGLDYFL